MNKAKTFATITLVLMLTFATVFIALPTVSSQKTNKTYSFIDAIPNPVGVNQYTLLNFGALNFLNIADDGWNVTISITKPDGKFVSLGPIKTFSTGTYGMSYVPDQVGTYQLKTIFPEQEYQDVIYLASESDVLKLVVTEGPVMTYPGHSLPTEYWYRPIDSQLREWWSIAGSWTTKPQNLFAPYNDGPETSHILWQMPIGDTQGGLTGGDTWAQGMDDGDAYEGKVPNSLIVNGIFYYNKKPGYFGGGDPQQTVVAVDMHTGKQLWEKEFTFGDGAVDFGMIYYHNSINNRGAHSYIVFISGGGWGWPPPPANWHFCDAYTGDWKFDLTNIPSGSSYIGPNGEIYKYQVTNIGNSTEPDWRLLRWSTTKSVQGEGVGSFVAESWAPGIQGATFDATERGYDMNISISALNLPGTNLPGSVGKVFVNDKVVGTRVTQTEVNLWAISLKYGNEGTLLYNTTWNTPSEWIEGNLTIGGIGQAGWVAWSQEEQVAVFFTKENIVHYAFNLENGQFLYETEPQIYADAWSDTVTETFGPDRIIAYGRLYSATVGGIVYCYNATTGERLWTYEADDPYTESYISNNWWIIPLFATDNMVYFGSLEHSALDPKPRGTPFFALDPEGNVVWRVNGLFRQTRWGGRAIIGDSIIVTQDTYDQQIYGIGKGPSSVTVSAEAKATAGLAVLISGAVTDVSPGTQNDALMPRFPNGVPAVSDECMNDWMLYIYKQFEQPADVTGVTVTLEAITPAGEYQYLGTTTSDVYGNYGYTFTPDTEGLYMIIARFDGSDAYYGSTSTTYLSVDPAAPYPDYPGYEGPTAGDVAEKVLDNLPEDVDITAEDVAEEILKQFPPYPDYPEAPEYTTIDLAIIATVIVVAVLVVYTLYTVKKQRK